MYPKGFFFNFRLAACRSRTVCRLMFASARASSFVCARAYSNHTTRVKSINSLPSSSAVNQVEHLEQQLLEIIFDSSLKNTGYIETSYSTTNMGSSNSRCVAPASPPPPPHLTGCRSVQPKTNTMCACVKLNAHTSTPAHQQLLHNHSHHPSTTWLLCSASPQMTFANALQSNGAVGVCCHQQTPSVAYCGCQSSNTRMPFWQTAAVNGDSPTSGWDDSAQPVTASGLHHHTFAQSSVSSFLFGTNGFQTALTFFTMKYEQKLLHYC